MYMYIYIYMDSSLRAHTKGPWFRSWIGAQETVFRVEGAEAPSRAMSVMPEVLISSMVACSVHQT